MIITFCGHSDFSLPENIQETILEEIEKIAQGQDMTFYLGYYGHFDFAAKNACVEYKKKHPGNVLVFVTPYLIKTYLKDCDQKIYKYDEILYPDLENVFPKYAILERNKYMVREADYVIAYIRHSFGGAYKTYK